MRRRVKIGNKLARVGTRLRAVASLDTIARHVLYVFTGSDPLNGEFRSEIFGFDWTAWTFLAMPTYARTLGGRIPRNNFCGLHFCDSINAVVFGGGNYPGGSFNAARDLVSWNGRRWCLIIPLDNLRPADSGDYEADFCPDDCMSLLTAGDCMDEEVDLKAIWPQLINYSNLGMMGHTHGSACYDQVRDCLYFVGGTTQAFGQSVNIGGDCDWGEINSPFTFEFSFATKKWRVMTCTGPVFNRNVSGTITNIGRRAASPGQGDMVYDRDRQRAILFGGTDVSGGEAEADSGYFGDTWELDPTATPHTDMWTKTRTKAQGPGARFEHAICYVPVWKDDDDVYHGGYMLLHGGQMASGGAIKNEWWKYGYTLNAGTGELTGSPTWTDITGDITATDTMPGRIRHSIAFDENRKKVVIAGGVRYDVDEFTPLDSQAVALTAELDVLTLEHVVVAPATPLNPGLRINAGFIYDRCRKKCVLFGGQLYTDRGAITGDAGVWPWDGAAWVPEGDITESVSDQSRSGHAQLPIGGGVMLILGGDPLLQLTHLFYFGTFGVVRNYAVPFETGFFPVLAQYSARAAAAGDLLILGRNPSNESTIEFWKYDASVFNPATPPDGFDPYTANPWVAFTPQPTGMVGGVSNWMWTEFAMCYSAATGKLICYGGFRRIAIDPEAQSDVNDESTRWLASGTWDASSNNPSELGVLRGPDICCLPEISTLLGAGYESGFALFFGKSPEVDGGVPSEIAGRHFYWNDGSETWERMDQLIPSGHATPDPRYRHRIVGFPDIGKAVLFGGTDDSSVFSDTWLFDGSTITSDYRPWQLLAIAGPEARYGHTMEYDAARGCIVLYGGKSLTGAELSDLWEFRTDLKWHQIPVTTGLVDDLTIRKEAAIAFDKDHRKMIVCPMSTGEITRELDLDCGKIVKKATDPQPFADDGLPNSIWTRAVYDPYRKRTLMLTSQIGSSSPKVITGVYSFDTEGDAWDRELFDNDVSWDDTGSIAFDGAAVFHKVFKSDGITFSRTPVPGETAATITITRGYLILTVRGGRENGTRKINLNAIECETLDDLAAFINDLGTGWAATVDADGDEMSSTLKRTPPTAAPSSIKVLDYPNSYILVYGGEPFWSGLTSDRAWKLKPNGTLDGYEWEALPAAWDEIRNHVMCYDEETEKTYLFGGGFVDPSGLNWKVWEWTGTTFTEVTDSEFPSDWRPDPATAFPDDLYNGFAAARVVVDDACTPYLCVRIPYQDNRQPAYDGIPWPAGTVGGPGGDFTRFFAFNLRDPEWTEISGGQPNPMPQRTAGGFVFDAEA